jgi:regulator of cell morphogenesis and NO signaling
MQTSKQDITVNAIVVNDYRTADVFKRHGINYCCGNDISLVDACRENNIDIAVIEKELEQATRTITLSNKLKLENWRVDFLIDYIINVHHDFIKETLPSLQTTLLSFVAEHQQAFPELKQLIPVFQELAAVTMKQIQYEEEVFFPYIKQIEGMHRRREVYGGLFVKTLRKPLYSVVDSEHKEISCLMERIRAVTNNYIFPAGACARHQVLFHMLKELDNDLIQHKHLENNILFPKAMAIEKELLQL